MFLTSDRRFIVAFEDRKYLFLSLFSLFLAFAGFPAIVFAMGDDLFMFPENICVPTVRIKHCFQYRVPLDDASGTERLSRLPFRFLHDIWLFW